MKVVESRSAVDSGPDVTELLSHSECYELHVISLLILFFIPFWVHKSNLVPLVIPGLDIGYIPGGVATGLAFSDVACSGVSPLLRHSDIRSRHLPSPQTRLLMRDEDRFLAAACRATLIQELRECLSPAAEPQLHTGSYSALCQGSLHLHSVPWSKSSSQLGPTQQWVASGAKESRAERRRRRPSAGNTENQKLEFFTHLLQHRF